MDLISFSLYRFVGIFNASQRNAQNRCILSERLLITAAFIAFVLSIICFGWPVYQDCTQNEKTQLLNFEKKLFRLRLQNQNARMNDILKNINLKLMRKTLNHFNYHPLAIFFTRRSVDSYNLRRRNALNYFDLSNGNELLFILSQKNIFRSLNCSVEHFFKYN